MLILSRKKVLFITLSAFFLYFLIYKLEFLQGCSYTTGKIVKFIPTLKRTYDPVVEFVVKTKTIRFRGDASFNDYKNKEVTVVYKTEKPGDAKIFSFFGFWWSGILYSLFPLIIILAFVLSFVEKGESLVIDYSRFFKKKEDRQPFRLKVKNKEDEII